MILAPRLNWRKAWPALALWLALTALLLSIVIMTLYAFLPVSAAAPVATATPVPSCIPVASAGGVPVYRCIDEDMYIVCYSQGVMLFCVPQQ